MTEEKYDDLGPVPAHATETSTMLIFGLGLFALGLLASFLFSSMLGTATTIDDAAGAAKYALGRNVSIALAALGTQMAMFGVLERRLIQIRDRLPKV